MRSFYFYKVWAAPVPDKPGTYTYFIQFSAAGKGTWYEKFDHPERLRGFYEGMFVGAMMDFPRPETAEVPAGADHPENVRRAWLIQFRETCLQVLARPQEHPQPSLW